MTRVAEIMRLTGAFTFSSAANTSLTAEVAAVLSEVVSLQARLQPVLNTCVRVLRNESRLVSLSPQFSRLWRTGCLCWFCGASYVPILAYL